MDGSEDDKINIKDSDDEDNSFGSLEASTKGNNMSTLGRVI